MRRSILVGLAVLSLSIGSSAADDAFHDVPPPPGQKGRLELRVASYGNDIHGEMQVEVHNPGHAPVDFVVSGLYFVPDDDDDGEAPQRMGIIGGIRAGVEQAPRDAIAIAPGTTRKLRFDVYCIDRSRHGPSGATTYSLAPRRMPARLAVALAASTRPLLVGVLGAPDSGLTERLQELVWDVRRKVRARLYGEL